MKTASLLCLGLVFALTACGEPSPTQDAVAAGAGDEAAPPTPDSTSSNASSNESSPPLAAEPGSNPESEPSSMQSPSSGAKPIELRNRLTEETSPYLLQHQHNPVAWFPWGPEAFEAARQLDRPIFLSIGYSTCYWCHVMERESFESEEVAAVMNELFVCIKVDREERPDVDDIYMAAVQLTNQGQGGWPMSVFLEPNSLKPIMGGTYFPPVDSRGRPGFPSVLRQVASFWKDRRQEVIKQADAVAEAVTRQLSATTNQVELGPRQVERGITSLLSVYDREHGGFVGSPQKAPKFPIPSTLDFLIGAGWDTLALREAIVHTLDRMAIGGMYDQVGGGFHRYSTDSRWLVPHFEKMLYDNGQLASTYAEAHRKTNDPFYAQIVREILEYVLREMTSPGGAFYSAQDAEVNHREGQNYIWLADEVTACLSDAGLLEDIPFALEIYGLNKGTNFQDPHHPEDGPRNVLYLIDRPDAIIGELEIDLAEFQTRRQRVNQAMLSVRDKRDQPILDDKLLTAWNGLMIAGMADGAWALEDDRYRQAAERAMDNLLQVVQNRDGSLLRTARDGRAKIEAFSIDYACVIRGLLSLHRATQSSKYRQEAIKLADIMRLKFWDMLKGGYFDTLADQADLFVRTKSTYDGAVPSANTVMANNLIDLHAMTGEDRFLDDAVAVIESISGEIASSPTSPVLGTLALHRLLQSHPDRFGQAASSTRLGRSSLKEIQPLKIASSIRTVQLKRNQSVTFDVKLTLAPGYHVNSHKPGMEFLIPLELKLVDGAGLEMNVDYPEGEAYAGPDGRMMVHHKAVSIPVTLKQVGDIKGRPKVMLTYQICTDTACLAPETERVPVGVVGE